MTPAELQTQIRFALHSLGAANRQHDFEHLCRQFTRLRLARNILPATGPVSAGGDQGRDFESYTSDIQTHADVTTFVGVTDAQVLVAGACTLQQTDIDGKILDDVHMILKKGTRPGIIYYFCEVNIPVGHRHELQDKIREEAKVDLQIFDGNGLAELLTDRDIHWIAVQYLDLPVELIAGPEGPDAPDWYQAGYHKWLRAEPRLMPADFVELSELTRFAVRTKSARADVGFWIAKLERFLDAQGIPKWLRRDCIYEVVVATLRGLGRIQELEPLLDEYFAEIESLTSTSQLHDAQVLAAYCRGAEVREVADWRGKLDEWTARITNRVEELLAQSRGPSRCSLLETLGMLRLDGLHRRDESALDLAIELWLEALAEEPGAKLWPVESLSRAVSGIAPVLEPAARYRELTRCLDEALATRVGDAAAAAACRDRAIELRDAGKLLAALREFHVAKAKWFNGDSLRGSVLSMLVIAQSYENLRQYQGAKYYYLAGAFAAGRGDEEHLDLLAAGVIGAANCDYLSGAWLQFLSLAAVGARIYDMFVPKSEGFDEDDPTDRVIYHQAICRSIARSLLPAVVSAIEGEIETAGTKEYVDIVDAGEPFMRGRDDLEVLLHVDEQIGATPFWDAGPARHMAWRACGVEWRLVCENANATVVAAERLAVVLQILMVEMADVDLCLLPSIVELEVRLGDVKDRAQFRPSNEAASWLVTVSPHSPNKTADDLHIEAVAIAFRVLAEISLVGEDVLNEALETAFKEGLMAKVLNVNSHDVLVDYFLPDGLTPRIPRNDLRMTLAYLANPKEAGELSWRDGAGPTYSRAKASEYLHNRYVRLADATRYTLPRLMRTSWFPGVLGRLREEGWRDWRILSAIASIIGNYRLNARRVSWQAREEAFRVVTAPETEDEQVPLDSFSEKALRRMGQTVMMSTLKTWDLELRQTTPSIKAIERFMTERYALNSDDISHNDPFAAAAESQPSLARATS